MPDGINFCPAILFEISSVHSLYIYTFAEALNLATHRQASHSESHVDFLERVCHLTRKLWLLNPFVTVTTICSRRDCEISRKRKTMLILHRENIIPIVYL